MLVVRTEFTLPRGAEVSRRQWRHRYFSSLISATTNVMIGVDLLLMCYVFSFRIDCLVTW